MNAAELCDSPRRRALTREAELNGIDFVEVGADLASLQVYFLGRPPENLTPDNVRIEGGHKIREVRVTGVSVERAFDQRQDGYLRLSLERPGDAAGYQLCFVEPLLDERGAAVLDADGHPRSRPLSGFDPRYACLSFSFHAACPSDLDCRREPECPRQPLTPVAIDYLSKDYASFRRLLLDRLSLTMPNWVERHVPDLGITLVELLAYVGDHLSYFQDAVGTEAYLDTARRRISVRRHARLVDYQLHEGCSARAFVCVEVSREVSLSADQVWFATSGADGSGGLTAEDDFVKRFTSGTYEPFEPLTTEPLRFIPAHNSIRFYTWGDSECCLPRGATRATLRDSERQLALAAGDVLILEEVLGPRTANAADADPARRHAVRLTEVAPQTDPVTGEQVLEVAWGKADALPFPLCLSTIGPAPLCELLENVSVARGNVVLVDHGLRQPPEFLGQPPLLPGVAHCDCEGLAGETSAVPGPFEPSLQRGPLSFAQPLLGGSASAWLEQDPRASLPQVVVTSQAFRRSTTPEEGAISWGAVQSWTARGDLLQSGATDRDFVVEVDDGGIGHLRFGDGRSGRRPGSDFQLATSAEPAPPGFSSGNAPDGERGTLFFASYRVGCGVVGNVGAESIAYLVTRGLRLEGVTLKVRNPLPARGGVDPESVASAKLYAPQAFRRRLERAVTADDYARLTERDFPDEVQGAGAELRWTGSWYEARVGVDQLHRPDAEPALLERVEQRLYRYRRLLHDVLVVPARQVPLDIALVVCVSPHYERGHVKLALLEALSTRTLPDGSLGFFHPDRLKLGAGVRLSELVATARGVQGVEHVHVQRFQRAWELPQGELEAGILPIHPGEVARLDNDANYPENGALTLRLEGGR
ncbi:MAG TPA: putative baseplate assembly protein [Polyangiaceae bacterium]|nr:putative baseplate assembly protein [Polyangiaceae bacterium]